MTRKMETFKGLEIYKRRNHCSNIKYELSIDKNKFTYIPLA